MRPRLSGDEQLFGPGCEGVPGTVLEFWQWAFGDLCPNDIRGVFSEWLVAQLLELPLDRGRESWAAWDLTSPEGVKIEVKSCAYVQVWHEGEQASRIVWSGLSGQTWDAATGLYSGERSYNADLFVFCVQTERDPLKWNALNLSQWRFYLLTRSQLEELGVRSLSESRLRAISPPLTASEFQTEGKRVVALIAEVQHSPAT